MADLNVQPKTKSVVPWIFLALGIIALIFLLVRGCDNEKVAPASADSASTTNPNTAAPLANNWGDVDFNSPSAAYPEITDTNITVRGNSNYGIYGLGENILFDEGKSTIRTDAENNLKEVAASILQRYKAADVRIYGYTDAIGDAAYNKELAEQRAQAVSDWLSANGSISKDKITMEPVGEARPVASNATSEGRKQNRRVEIVARNTNGN